MWEKDAWAGWPLIDPGKDAQGNGTILDMKRNLLITAALSIPAFFSSCAPTPVQERAEALDFAPRPLPRYVAEGVTKNEVTALMGTPVSVASNPMSDADVWLYGPHGTSTVHFVKGVVNDWSDADRVLRVPVALRGSKASGASDDSKLPVAPRGDLEIREVNLGGSPSFSFGARSQPAMVQPQINTGGGGRNRNR